MLFVNASNSLTVLGVMLTGLEVKSSRLAPNYTSAENQLPKSLEQLKNVQPQNCDSLLGSLAIGEVGYFPKLISLFLQQISTEVLLGIFQSVMRILWQHPPFLY